MEDKVLFDRICDFETAKSGKKIWKFTKKKLRSRRIGVYVGCTQFPFFWFFFLREGGGGGRVSGHRMCKIRID